MKVVALVGSLRKDSLNKQLIRTIEQRYSDLFEIEIADIGALPHYNEDDEHSPTEIVQHFKSQIEEADAVIICTPEFNWSMPGVLKNALDWLSRVDRPLVGKAVLPMGVSQGGLGTIRAQLHLREVLASMGIQANVISPAGNEVLIGGGGRKFEDGKLKHEVTLEFLDEVMKRFVDFVKKESEQ